MGVDMERRVREGAGGELRVSEHASQTRENRMYFGRKEAASPNSALVITLECLSTALWPHTNCAVCSPDLPGSSPCPHHCSKELCVCLVVAVMAFKI